MGLIPEALADLRNCPFEDSTSVGPLMGTAISGEEPYRTSIIRYRMSSSVGSIVERAV